MQVSNNNQSYTNYNQYKEDIAKKLTEYAKNGDTEAIKKMVDEVVLSKVDSSSFDKYVEEMEGGKSSVADNFFSSLTKFLDDFVNGINNINDTNNTTKKEETKEPELFDVRKTNWSIVQQGIAAEIQNSKGDEYNPYSKSIGSTNPIFDLVNVDKNGKITLAKNAKETMKAYLHGTVIDQKESMQRVEVGNKLVGPNFYGTVPTQYTQNDILKLFGLNKSGKIDYCTEGFPKWHKFINDLETYINDDNKIDELLSNFMSSVGSEDGNSTTLEKLCNNLANTEIKYIGTFLGSTDNPFYFNQTLDNEHLQDNFKNGRGSGESRDEDIYDMLNNNYYYSRFLEKNNVSSNDNSANKNKTINSNKTIQNNFVSSASPSNNFFATTSSVVSNSSAQEYVPSSTRTNSANTTTNSANTTTSTYVPSETFTEKTKKENVKTSNIFTKIASTVKSEDINGVLDAMERKNITKTYTNANKIGDAAGVDFTKREFKKALEERKA